MSVLPSVGFARLLQGCLDALTLVLLVVVAASAYEDPTAPAVTVGFAAVYLVGRLLIRPDRHSINQTRGRSLPELGWLAALAVLWLALLWSAGVPAIWLAFPMTLLQMHVLGPRRGVIAVTATTAAAIATGLALNLDRLGAILGPTIGAGLSIAVILGLETLIRDSERRQSLIDELVATQEQLAQAEHERGTLAERERLAREIHDTLAQGLSSIELLLRVAEETGDHSQVPTARQVALDNLAEVRQFVRALAPADLSESTLEDALARIAARTTGVTVGWTVSGERRDLPVSTAAELVRIAQSTLANVTRHAQAASAELNLAYRQDSVLLTVTDDGVGFDPSAAGFGLRVLQERVSALGGQVQIVSAPSAGTTVSVEVPT